MNGRPLAILVALIALCMAASAALHAWLPSQREVAVPLHSALEAAGSVVAFIVAGLSLLAHDDDEDAGHRLWRSCALIAMGTLDAFHASVQPGDLFVWLRVTASLAGGLLVSLIWLPACVGRSRRARWLVVGVLIASPGFGAVSIAAGDALPQMVEAGGFSRTAIALDLIGGVGACAAAAHVLVHRRTIRSAESLFFGGMYSLLGLSAFLFPFSGLWTLDWWLWHFVRICAYLAALGYVGALFRRMAGRLQRTNEALRQSLQVRDDFLSIASHEMKTPLTALVLRLQVLAKMIKRGQPAEPALVDKAITDVGQLNRLMDDLLDISQIHAGRLALSEEPISLGVVVGDLVASFRPISGKHDMVFEDAPDEVRVRADRLRIGQVITNLLTNAIKYSPDGGRILVALSVRGREAVLSVADSGIGIPEDQQSRVFQRFFRVQGAGHYARGLGLGLFICRDIVERHGGRIWLDSRLGIGTTFYVALPWLDAPSA